MSEKSVQFVIAIFESEKGAEETLSALKADNKEALNGVQAAVAMRKDTNGWARWVPWSGGGSVSASEKDRLPPSRSTRCWLLSSRDRQRC